MTHTSLSLSLSIALWPFLEGKLMSMGLEGLFSEVPFQIQGSRSPSMCKTAMPERKGFKAIMFHISSFLIWRQQYTCR